MNLLLKCLQKKFRELNYRTESVRASENTVGFFDRLNVIAKTGNIIMLFFDNSSENERFLSVGKITLFERGSYEHFDLMSPGADIMKHCLEWLEKR